MADEAGETTDWAPLAKGELGATVYKELRECSSRTYGTTAEDYNSAVRQHWAAYHANKDAEKAIEGSKKRRASADRGKMRMNEVFS